MVFWLVVLLMGIPSLWAALRLTVRLARGPKSMLYRKFQIGLCVWCWVLVALSVWFCFLLYGG